MSIKKTRTAAMKKYEYILFDLDGTLVDTVEDLTLTMQSNTCIMVREI